MVRRESAFKKEQPFGDFIDPDNALHRKFRGSRLLGPEEGEGRQHLRGAEAKPPPLSPTLTVFEDRDEHVQRAWNSCVPFHGPGNQTFRMCVYESEVDQMISAAIRDQGLWEKEQVEDLAAVLRDNRDRVYRSHSRGQDGAARTAGAGRGVVEEAEALHPHGRKFVTNTNPVGKDSVKSGRIVGHLRRDSAQGSRMKHEDFVKGNSAPGDVTEGNSRLHNVRKDFTHNGITEEDSESESIPHSKTVSPPHHLITPGDVYPDQLMTVVDIGCNVGVYTLTAAVQGHPVVAVDPVVSNLRLLASSLRLANLTSRVTVLLNAITDTPGPVSVHVNPGNIGGSTVKKMSGVSRQTEAGPQSGASRTKIQADSALQGESESSVPGSFNQLSKSSVSGSSNQLSKSSIQAGSNQLSKSSVPASSNQLFKSSVPGSFNQQSKSSIQARSNRMSKSSPRGSPDQHSFPSIHTVSSRQSAGTPGPGSVWAVCLDHLLPLVPTRRVFLKMDVEGGEERVLRCAARFFQQLHVTHVLMEWLFLRHGRDGARAIDFLVRNGFLPYTDVTKTVMLVPEDYRSWPDNVMWIKR